MLCLHYPLVVCCVLCVPSAGASPVRHLRIRGRALRSPGLKLKRCGLTRTPPWYVMSRLNKRITSHTDGTHCGRVVTTHVSSVGRERIKRGPQGDQCHQNTRAACSVTPLHVGACVKCVRARSIRTRVHLLLHCTLHHLGGSV